MCMYVVITIYIALHIFEENPIALLLHANLSQMLHSRGQSGPIHNLWFCVRTSLPQGFSRIILQTFPTNGCRPKAEDSLENTNLILQLFARNSGQFFFPATVLVLSSVLLALAIGS